MTSCVVRAAGLEPARENSQWIFLPATAFAAAKSWRLWSGLSLHRTDVPLGAARLVSTPSRFRAWLGISSKAFPNFG
jgi:hypothetical protein